MGGWEDGLGAGRRRGKGESRGLLLVLVVPAEMNNPLVVLLLSIGLVHRFHFTLVSSSSLVIVEQNLSWDSNRATDVRDDNG